MAVDSLSASFQIGCSYQVQKNVTGASYTPFTGSGTPKKQINFALAGGSVAKSVNEIYSAITTVAGGANTSLDLTVLVDAARSSGVALVRLKGVIFRLLSTEDDSTNGTAASSVTIGNGTNPNAMFLTLGTTTFDLKNGEALGWMTPSAGGVTVDGTHKTIKILNNDVAITAAVEVTLLGSDS